jgi:hypothetical protein
MRFSINTFRYGSLLMQFGITYQQCILFKQEEAILPEAE